MTKVPRIGLQNVPRIGERLQIVPRIGLEIHIQLDTKSKLFCPCPVTFAQPANSQLCPVCAGLPGALPVLNRQAVVLAVRLALALGCRLNETSRFARKSYFYPDLPKGYQITQHEQIFATGGQLEAVYRHDGALLSNSVPLSGMHLEEDAGKSLHRDQHTLVDLNRAGTPLIEVVTEPALQSPEHAAALMRALRGLVRALGVSRGDLERGSMRCDANVSLRYARAEADSAPLVAVGAPLIAGNTPRVELKNINSFRFVKRAIAGEIARQTRALELNQPLVQETRRYDAERDISVPMRKKELGDEYRYFAEPDLPALWVDPELIAAQRASLPELPVARARRFARDFQLPAPLCFELCADQPFAADYVEALVDRGIEPKRAVSWVKNEVLAQSSKQRSQSAAGGPRVAPAALAELLSLVEQGRLTNRQAKAVFVQMWEQRKSAAEIVAERGMQKRSDPAELEPLIARVLAANEAQVQAYRGGRRQLFAFFMGAVMKTTSGNADPQVVNQLLRRKLDE
jgi:aspartyl-tRNA(Asn)/glutamyl-tRNA(Gln) amidotransferase subunit B